MQFLNRSIKSKSCYPFSMICTCNLHVIILLMRILPHSLKIYRLRLLEEQRCTWPSVGGASTPPPNPPPPRTTKPPPYYQGRRRRQQPTESCSSHPPSKSVDSQGYPNVRKFALSGQRASTFNTCNKWIFLFGCVLCLEREVVVLLQKRSA